MTSQYLLAALQVDPSQHKIQLGCNSISWGHFFWVHGPFAAFIKEQKL